MKILHIGFVLFVFNLATSQNCLGKIDSIASKIKKQFYEKIIDDSINNRLGKYNLYFPKFEIEYFAKSEICLKFSELVNRTGSFPKYFVYYYMEGSLNFVSYSFIMKQKKKYKAYTFRSDNDKWLTKEICFTKFNKSFNSLVEYFSNNLMIYFNIDDSFNIVTSNIKIGVPFTDQNKFMEKYCIPKNDN